MRPSGSIALQFRQSVDDTRDNGGEQRLLAGKMSINRWFARRSPCCDLVDARALETSFKKDPLGGIEDAPLDIAGKVLRRPAGAAGLVLLLHSWPSIDPFVGPRYSKVLVALPKLFLTPYWQHGN